MDQPDKDNLINIDVNFTLDLVLVLKNNLVNVDVNFSLGLILFYTSFKVDLVKFSKLTVTYQKVKGKISNY